MMTPRPMTKEMQDHYLKTYQEWLKEAPDNKYIQDVVSSMISKQSTTILTNTQTITESKGTQVNKNEQLKTETFTKDEILRLGEIKKTVATWANRIGHHGKMVIAGGCFASLINGEQVKDVDVFFLDMPSNDYLSLIKYLGINVGNLIDRSDYTRGNDNITSVWNAEDSDYQFIFTKYKTREELIAHFDYVHCMVSYANYAMYITRQAYDAIKNKHLIVNNDKQVKQWRREKFISRGFVEGKIVTKPKELTQDEFDAMIRAPVSGAGWQQAARINPMGRGLGTLSTNSNFAQTHIDKLLKDLRTNGQ